MGESFTTAMAFKGLFSAVDPQMLFQMVLELERLPALLTFESTHLRERVVGDHVTLKSIDVGK